MSIIETPVHLEHLTLKNRVVRSAVHSFLADEEGRMTEAEYAMYAELAQGGVGTIITGHCCVDPRGRANATQVNIYDDADAAQFRRAVKTAHAAGAVLIPQISHAGPRAIGYDDLVDVVARPLKKGREARALTREEIGEIEQHFIAAAVRLKAAGCDGVQLHAAHSYLLSRFLDPTFNQRTDDYGGSQENRFRIVREIIEGIQAACGAAFPILVKINLDTKHEDHKGYHEAMVYMLREFQRLGVELVELSGVDFINQPRGATLYYLEEGARLKAAVPGQAMSLVGGVRSLADMERVLAAGFELVSLGRALIAEPDFLRKELAGGAPSICVSCCRCFVLPEMHPGYRCVWQWKEARAKARAQKAAAQDA